MLLDMFLDLMIGWFNMIGVFLANHLEVKVLILYFDYLIYPELGNTNVHTLFSDLIIDFGIVGTIMFFSISGFLSGLLMSKIKNLKPSSISLLTLMYLIILYSFLISPLKYTSIIIAFIEFYLVLKLIFINKITINSRR